MKKDFEDSKIIQELIKSGDLDKIKELVNKKVDMHYGNDYFLYLAVFHKQIEIQKYLINIGLDPELTKGRMEIANPERLKNIRCMFHNEERIIKGYSFVNQLKVNC